MTWPNPARILGMASVATPTSKSTFATKTGSYQSAATAGMKSPKRTLNGENMSRIDLNMVRSHIGRKVNLYLKDGSVIINVLITNAGRNLCALKPKQSMLNFTTAPNRKTRGVPLREIEWMEPVFVAS